MNTPWGYSVNANLDCDISNAKGKYLFTVTSIEQAEFIVNAVNQAEELKEVANNYKLSRDASDKTSKERFNTIKRLVGALGEISNLETNELSSGNPNNESICVLVAQDVINIITEAMKEVE